MKTVVIYSGGLDSTVLLVSLIQLKRDVHALSINYGQRHKRELAHAKDICLALGIPHQVADLSGLKPLLGGSSQTDENIPVPHGHYAEETMKLTVVPNRNMLMLSVAGAWAISLKASTIAYAAHAGDHAVYPDCRESFVKPLTEALANADWHTVGIERPFINKTKAEIVKLGFAIGAPLGQTYSCYEGGPVHCGRCGTCTERAAAFVAAGVPDPTPYLDAEYFKTLPA